MTVNAGQRRDRHVSVLFVTPWYPTATDPAGGAFCRDAFEAVRAQGHAAHVLHVAPTAGSGSSAHRRARYPSTSRGALPIGIAAGALATLRAIREWRPDVVHAHVSLPLAPGALIAARAFGVPIVLTEHTGPFESLLGNRARAMVVDATLRRMDALCVVSRFLAASIERRVRRRIDIVPNPVDTNLFRRAMRAAPRQDRLLFVGRLAPEKRVDLILEAIARLSRRLPRLSLRVIGTGSEEAALIRLARTLGIADRVEFSGVMPRERVPEGMAAADLLILPSDVETFGSVLVEALATGRPVLATRSGGPIDIVEPSVGGLVSGGDAAELAEAIAAQLDRPWDERALSDYAERWSLDAYAERQVAIYRRLLDG